MIGKHLSAFAFSMALAVLAGASPVTAAPYDGSWNMLLVTTNGHCGKIKVGLAIQGSKIKSTSGKFVMHPVHIVGLIYGGGQAKMNGVAGPRQAVGTGRFTKAKGYGKWNGTGPSGVCSGIWTAARA